MRSKVVISLIVSLFLQAEALGDGVTISSTEARTRLVELFSSEGCSSCPPADAWLSGLRTRPGLWKTFVPIEFHVDYWNRLGWVDRFSRQTFTGRQQQYAAEWGGSNVYTPGFVLDGKEWRDSSRDMPESGETVGVLTAHTLGGGRVSVHFRPTHRAISSWRAYATLLGNGLESKIGAGENAGRTLRHDFVVLALNLFLLPSGSARPKARNQSRPSEGRFPS